MSDDTSRQDPEDGLDAPSPDEIEPLDTVTGEDYVEAERAEAEEAQAAAEEYFGEGGYEGDYGDDEEARQALLQEVMAEAQRDSLRARAAWSLVHGEHLVFLFANCLFFAGVLAVWHRIAPGTAVDATLPETWAANYINGLDTIRGAAIFALALYGFWTVALNIWFRQLKIWPFLINALLALWVGIPGFTRTIGSERWDQAVNHLEGLQTRTLLDKVLIPLSSVPPGYWLLTLGGAMVLIVLLKGVISGASTSKPAPASGGGRRRRR